MKGGRAKVIGLAGGVAAGKSLVAGFLRELGAVVIDADRLGHEALENSDVKRALRERWGDAVFDADGRVDRRRLGAVVFQDEESRAFLNALVHPGIRRRMSEELDRTLAQGRARVIALDAALLFEAGLETWCDATVFVDAPLAAREARARRQRRWDAAELTRRESAQTPPEEKRRRATFIVDNSAGPEATRRQVADLYSRLVAADTASEAGPK